MKKEVSKSKASKLREAKYIIEYWQKHLRMMDWEFKVDYCFDQKEMGDAFATNRQNANYQTSTIRVLDPDNVPKDWSGCRDLEVTLVHELLHTRLLYAVGRTRRDNWHLEMAIETIAKALVANKRGVSPEEID